MAVLEHQTLLKGVFIERIYNRLYALAHKGVGFRVYPDIRRIRYLLYANYNMHGSKMFLSLSHFSTPKWYSVRDLNVSPGRSTVDGNSGWFGESG